jgi:hypothetical protein
VPFNVVELIINGLGPFFSIGARESFLEGGGVFCKVRVFNGFDLKSAISENATDRFISVRSKSSGYVRVVV